jgi:TonB family protein
LVLAAFVIAPRLIDRQSPATSTSLPQTSEAPPVKESAPPPKAVVRNEIIQRVLPEVPSEARRTIQGRVKVSVRVRVDPTGKVAEAKLDSAGPSKYFARLALQAARRWKFAPAPDADPGRPREWVLHFEFERTGTKVAPVRRAS